ncbi:hypothetical protein WI93_17805 [Burkholderia vietnamiensis]|nr:hypothetical protein WI93_17805 [Burkholderia vietnamiensis]
MKIRQRQDTAADARDLFVRLRWRQAPCCGDAAREAYARPRRCDRRMPRVRAARTCRANVP